MKLCVDFDYTKNETNDTGNKKKPHGISSKTLIYKPHMRITVIIVKEIFLTTSACVCLLINIQM